jgi:hypothetical protein
MEMVMKAPHQLSWIQVALLASALMTGCGKPSDPVAPKKNEANDGASVRRGPAPEQLSPPSEVQPPLEKPAGSDAKGSVEQPTATPKVEIKPKPPANAAPELFTDLPEWAPEVDPRFTRQRPVALIVVSEDYGPQESHLETPAPVGMALAEALAHCGYEVRILVGLYEATSPATHWSVGRVCQRIREINQSLADRDDNKPDNLAPGVAPLKPLVRPVVFTDAKSLTKEIQEWLRRSFQVNNVVEGEANVAPRNDVELPKEPEAPAPKNGKKPRKKKSAPSENPLDATFNPRLLTPEIGTAKPVVREGGPPFGLIYFNGHGATHGAFADPHDTYYAPRDYSLRGKEQVAAAKLVSFQKVADYAIYTCHAPLWICGDCCRSPMEIAARPGLGPPSRVIHFEKRQLTFPPPWDEAEARRSDVDRLRPVVDQIEELRSMSSAGAGIIKDSRANATLVFPDFDRVEVPDIDSLSLGHHLALLMRSADDSPGSPRIFVDPAAAKATSWMLKDLFEKTKNRVKLASRQARSSQIAKGEGGRIKLMQPCLIPGPVGEGKVVASTIRGFQYPRAKVNLITDNLSFQDGLSGFTVSHDGKGNVPVGAVDIRRDQATFDKSHGDFKAVFRLKKGYDLDPMSPRKLVIQVAAKSDNPKHEIQFVVGAYDVDTKGKYTLLTTAFQNYGSAESVKRSLSCDGKPAFYETPLNLNIENGRLLRALEFQAVPVDPAGSWPQGATLTLLGAYLVPAEVNAPDIQNAIVEAGTRKDRGTFVGEWWATSSLRSDVKQQVTATLFESDEGRLSLLLDGTNHDAGWWGRIGDVYPRRFVDDAKSQMRRRIATPDPAHANADLTLCVYSDTTLLAAHKTTLAKAAMDPPAIPFLASGLVDEIAIVVRGAPEVTIEDISIVPVN